MPNNDKQRVPGERTTNAPYVFILAFNGMCSAGVKVPSTKRSLVLQIRHLMMILVTGVLLTIGGHAVHRQLISATAFQHQPIPDARDLFRRSLILLC